MSWSSFVIDAVYITDKEVTFTTFKGWDDATIIALHQNEAKRRMLDDLLQALNFTDETDSDFVEVLTTQETFLKNQLSLKQLELYFFDNAGNIESKDYAKFKYYSKQYSDGAARYSSLYEVLPKPIFIIQNLR